MDDGTAYIEIREEPNQQLELWAYVPQENARQWAREILEDMWNYCKRPAVYVNGRKLQIKKPKGWQSITSSSYSASTIKLSSLLSYGKHPTSGRGTVWHTPTRMILAHVHSEQDARLLAGELDRYSRKGFDSNQASEVRQALPRDFVLYLQGRIEGEIYEIFKKGYGSISRTNNQLQERGFIPEKKVDSEKESSKLGDLTEQDSPETQEDGPMGKKKKEVAKKTAREMVCKLYLGNNKAKRTDQQIQALVKKAFPKRKAIRSLSYIRGIRTQLNQGKIKKHGKPKSPILSWNEHRSTNKPGAKKKVSKASKKKVSKKKKLVKKAQSTKSAKRAKKTAA